jgi:hypothetical protein
LRRARTRLASRSNSVSSSRTSRSLLFMMADYSSHNNPSSAIVITDSQEHALKARQHTSPYPGKALPAA